ncbi:MAG: hypothetical protein AVDCRST_MAG53-2839 [uncultured Solirubrobacteraceae bacterium]|uniref:Uncharacterized protein n=1 Tax=uncultured Solirubrobacteraceae bacterium TaxID=1162706 RepID=A0A6J4SZM9_9ACTN|nr:MAG: hypothetical protein AVDCRST_MAG53-2839 [uncultured Solirubrobacteraceae bacterium]
MRPRRRTSRVQVRGCGCCLPIPLGVLTLTAVALRGAYAHRRTR